MISEDKVIKWGIIKESGSHFQITFWPFINGQGRYSLTVIFLARADWVSFATWVILR